MSSLSFKAGDFKQTDRQKKDVEKIVNGIISDIYRMLKGMPVDDYKTTYTYGLPILFQIPNMSHEVSKRKVYAKLIMELLRRDFEVAFDDSEKDRVSIEITIYSKEELHERDQETAIIDRYRKKKRPTIAYTDKIPS